MDNALSQKYFNRDLSWLKFNERVLYQAQDSRVPLLERVRFLGIFSSNLDEFFMKRVGFLKAAANKAIPNVGTDLANPSRILEDVRKIILKHIELRQTCYEKSIYPELNKNGIFYLKWEDLKAEEKIIAKDYFLKMVFPVLTPLAVDKSHPFPFLSNLSVSLGITLIHPKKGDQLFARIKIPDVLPQWMQISADKQGGYRFIRLRDLIAANIEELFPDMIIREVLPFRITRSAEVGETSDEVDDRLDVVEEELRLRRMADIVRLEYTPVKDQAMLHILRSELDLQERDIFENPGEISFHTVNEVANLNIPQLRYRPYTPNKPVLFRDEERDVFSLIRDQDILVHHPYDSFNESVERFIREAVKDPHVLAIKMTLYRAGENNLIIPLLIEAAEKGKQVVAVIELKARFDEARNIYWSEMLEEAGVHVVYGVLGKKIHCKTVLVIRKEGDSYRYYSHIGTGNYNPGTARLYTDLGLFSADKKIGNELIEVFNFLTGLSLKKNYQKLLVAPVNLRKRLLQYIKKEMEVHVQQGGGYIFAKMNSLEDVEICEALYQASTAGVKIDLVVRGFCCLVPGVKGLSENIRVLSIVGRYLEHSRLFYFGRGAKDPVEGKFYIGSADWMYRNLNNRIEVVVPIEGLTQKLYCWNLIQLILADNTLAWDLLPTGEYQLRKPEKTDHKGLHEELMRLHGEKT